MDREENPQQVLVGNDFRVESDVDHFGVFRIAGTDLFVGWIGFRSPGVAWNGLFNPFYGFKSGFYAPETTAAQRSS
jgi:hypothetical protein